MSVASQSLGRFRRRRDRRSGPQPLAGHLGELRTRMLICLGAFVVLSSVAFAFFSPVLDLLLRPLCSLPAPDLGPQGCRLVVTGPVEPFMVRFKVTAMLGLIASSPVWLYQVWAFVVPGLKTTEKRYIAPFVSVSMTLFLIGALFAYLTMPFGLRFLLTVGGPDLVPFLTATSYLNFIGLMVIAFGVTFELPLVVFFLGLVGAVTVEQLRKWRRPVIVGIFLLAAVVTPSQDPYTMSLMAVPLYLFYEISVFALAMIRRKKAARGTTPSP